jgi:hypothetical protein
MVSKFLSINHIKNNMNLFILFKTIIAQQLQNILNRFQLKKLHIK